MNFIKYIGLLALVILMGACKKEKVVTDETAGLTLVKTIANATHNINLYTQNGKLQQGYNRIFLQIKDKNDNSVNNAVVSWAPLMHMMSMQHACPYSTVGKTTNKTSLYDGYIVFTMAGNDTEYWELKLDYNIDGTAYTATSNIDVVATTHRNIVSFTGTDNAKYIIAMVEPTNPKVALNDMQAMVFKTESMMNYPTIDGYTVKIDPRMPGMGNHGSPNNVDLVQSGSDKIYRGKLSLTMTGYWKINLQLANAAGTVLKGEPVTDTNESSSIFFEIEF